MLVNGFSRSGIDERALDFVVRLIGVSFDGALGISEHQAATITSIDAGLIDNTGILNIVTGVAHYCHACVESGGNFVESYDVNRAGLDEGRWKREIGGLVDLLFD